MVHGSLVPLPLPCYLSYLPKPRFVWFVFEASNLQISCFRLDEYSNCSYTQPHMVPSPWGFEKGSNGMTPVSFFFFFISNILIVKKRYT